MENRVDDLFRESALTGAAAPMTPTWHGAVLPPFWLPLLAGLPVGALLAVMAPDAENAGTPDP
jgi:hypothetical protein